MGTRKSFVQRNKLLIVWKFCMNWSLNNRIVSNWRKVIIIAYRLFKQGHKCLVWKTDEIYTFKALLIKKVEVFRRCFLSFLGTLVLLSLVDGFSYSIKVFFCEMRGEALIRNVTIFAITLILIRRARRWCHFHATESNTDWRHDRADFLGQG